MRASVTKRKPPPVTVAIFDLDDTLYDCFRQRVMAAHRHAAEAMVRAGIKATVEQVLRARMQAFRTDPHLRHIDGEICRRFGVRDREPMMHLAREAYFSCPVDKLTLFPGARRVLRELHRRGVREFIVTFGNPATQYGKVAALGLHRESCVKEIFYADTQNVVTKESVFLEILRQTRVGAGSAMVIGDRPSGEILAGKRLGMRTVRIRRGEFAALEPQGTDEQADFQIKNISELLKLPLEFGVAATEQRSAKMPRRSRGEKKKR